jgi:hypothetical protein
MAILSIVGAVIVWSILAAIADLLKEAHAQAQDRRDDRIMVAWRQQEAACFHAERLAKIDRTVWQAAEEMSRIVAEEPGEVLEEALIRIIADWRAR